MNILSTNEITITQTASKAVRDLMIERKLQNHALRIFVSGSTCSGVQYGMAFEGQARPEDVILEIDDLRIIIDEVSINYLHGATVDYFEDQTSKGFLITNPNVIASCGCGDNKNNPSNGVSGCQGCS